MPAIPDFGPDGPPPLFFLGGWPSVALIAIYGIGVVPSRYVKATVGNVTVGERQWPVGGLVLRNLVKITHAIVYPNTDYPCYAELQALIDAIVARHPVKLRFTNKSFSSSVNANSPRKRRDERAYSEPDIFGGPKASFVPIYLAVAEVATPKSIMDVLQTSRYMVTSALERYEKIGAVRRVPGAPLKPAHWGLDPSFFAYQELRALLLALAARYRPEFQAHVARARRRSPKLAAVVEKAREANNLSFLSDTLSISRDNLSK